MKKFSVLLLAISMVLTYAISSCTTTNKTATAFEGVNMANFDTTINPADDFYTYVNGGWLKNNPVPSTEARWASFSEVTENNLKVLLQVCQDAASNKTAAPGSNEQKIGDFYASGMDSVKLEADGIKPLQDDFEKINSIKTISDVVSFIAKSQSMFMAPAFAFYAGQDDKNSSSIVPQLHQAGLGLPDRDYYTNQDARSANIRLEYANHIAKMFELAGSNMDDAKSAAAAVIDIETQLAKVSLTRTAMRDPNLIYNKKTISEVSVLMPNLNFENYLTLLGVNNASYVIIDNPIFYQTVDKMLASIAIDKWKTYLKWNVINSWASCLSNAMVMADFDFNQGILKGTKEIKPRYKRVIESTDQFLGEALGELYCNKAFTPETKARALEMVNNLGVALRDRINTLTWMSAATKTKAIAKLNKFVNKIGYPDKWRDYSKLTIDKSSYCQNVQRASAFEFNRMIAKIGQPVDKTEWGMSPPTVNAYYNPGFNEIVFPAGILQPPFFNAKADDAINYGGIGGVIGHEMTHGFDDQGRLYDLDGNLKNWWTETDSANFVQKANVLVSQFNNYTVLDSMHVNGELTLGENIADLGGLTIAYEAFKKTKQFKDQQKIDGFTPNQRFFIGWATVWRQNVREQEQMRRLIVDPHSPGKLRCNGPLSNMPQFYEAFGVKQNNGMWRNENEQAKIW
ncbi:MAG: M13 family metallopeptidase [Bacteroidia bacterium]|nr:M13 family metallopeptidase [Bacteroidia bacterium]